MPRTTLTVSGMLTTQNQGGGSKKAGLVLRLASVAQAQAYKENGYLKNVTFMMKDLPGQPKCMARPTGFVL